MGMRVKHECGRGIGGIDFVVMMGLGLWVFELRVKLDKCEKKVW